MGSDKIVRTDIVGRDDKKLIRKVIIEDGIECVSYTPYEWLNPPSAESKKKVE